VENITGADAGPSSHHLNRFLFDLKMNEQFSWEAAAGFDGAAYRLAQRRGAKRQAAILGGRQLGAHGMLAPTSCVTPSFGTISTE
jgi:hypothetical protein